jgi:hypothetical protein
MLDKGNIDKVRAAKEQVVNGSLVIWNARLEALISMGDVVGALNHMQTPAEISDNCSCGNNCSCGSAQRQFAVDPPLEVTGSKK